MHSAMNYTGKTCLPYDHQAWKETLSFKKPVLQSIPQGEQATVAITELDSHHRYGIFGDTTAVAIITLQLVCSGSDNTELFSNHCLSVERVHDSGGPSHSKLWLTLGHLPS